MTSARLQRRSKGLPLEGAGEKSRRGRAGIQKKQMRGHAALGEEGKAVVPLPPHHNVMGKGA